MRVIPFVCKGKARGMIGKLSPLSDNQADVLHEEVIYDLQKSDYFKLVLGEFGKRIGRSHAAIRGYFG